MTRVVRPIVRSFHARFVKEAVAWVKKGGHAVYWESSTRARLVIPVPKKLDVGDLGYWSVLDLGTSRYETHATGRFRGLSSLRVPRSCNDIMKRRATRDSVHAGPHRTVNFDCLECGACCRDNEVILEDEDHERFAKGGRPELGRPPLAKKRGKRLVLTLLRTKDCRHLGRDLKCGIYTLRPNACREFPVGSECCMFARQDGLGVVDGAID